MKRFPTAALATLLLWAAALPGAQAQTAPAETAASTPIPSALDAPLFYQLLLGEMSARGEQPEVGQALILDAARKTNDPALYQRAVDMAFQARDGEAALQAAQAWKRAFPQSREASRYALQILVALNKVEESGPALRGDLALAEAADRAALIAVLPRVYGRVTDKKLAATVVERSLADYLNQPATASPAWTTVGRLRLAAGDTAGALEAARRAQSLDTAAEGPVLLALELMDPKLPDAETMVRRYLAGKPLPEIRMAYARALLDAQRSTDALEQLARVTSERPELAEAWLIQGVLLAQDNQLQSGEAALKRFLDLSQSQRPEDRSRTQAQAFLALAQIAEKRGDFAQAAAWLDRIENAQELLAAQSRRASLLARQGKLPEARALLKALPERTPADWRMKTMAEVQLLRDFKQYRPAYDLLTQAIARAPKDHELLYDQAMLAEKMGDLAGMERILRDVIALKPDYHHAYNALGYSLADRGVRLPEARQLIEKALAAAPGDPFITDSLAWVHFRMGNKAEALKLLETAYKTRPDPEIAAHLGEVLWSLGQRDRAQSIWREGLLLGADNETLQETLKRLGVQP